MPTENRALADDAAAIAAAVRALAVASHRVLTRATGGGPDRPQEPVGRLLCQIENIRRMLNEARSEEGRLQDVRRWLDGLHQRLALVAQEQDEPRGRGARPEGRAEDPPG